MIPLYRGFAILGALVVCAIVVGTAIDVTGRNLGFGSLHGMIEAAALGMAFIVYCGVAFRERELGHISVTLVVDKLPTRLKRVTLLFSTLMGVAIAAFLAWGSLSESKKSHSSGERLIGISSLPVWPARLVVGIGLLLLAVALVQSAVSELRKAEPK